VLSLSCAVNLNQVPGPGSESPPGCFRVYAAFDLTTCADRHPSVKVFFKRSKRSGSASTTKPNAMPPTNSQRCCHVMLVPMSIAETITPTVASLFFKACISPCSGLLVKATGRTRRDHGLSRCLLRVNCFYLHQALREPGSVMSTFSGSGASLVTLSTDQNFRGDRGQQLALFLLFGIEPAGRRPGFAGVEFGK